MTKLIYKNKESKYRRLLEYARKCGVGGMLKKHEFDAILDYTDALRVEIELLKSVTKIMDIAILKAGEKVGLIFGCDTPDKMADEILKLRAERDGIAEENRMLSERIERLVDANKKLTALEAEVKRLASRKVCQKCGGSGELTDTHYVTRDMAIDAGNRSMEGMPIEDSYPCEDCNGTGYTEDK